MTEAEKKEKQKKEQVMTKKELKDYIRAMPEGTMLEISFGKEKAHV